MSQRLEVEWITRKAFEALPEYSCSMPTGVFPGRVWRCNQNAYAPGREGLPPDWIIAEYVRSDPGTCRVEIRIPEIV